MTDPATQAQLVKSTQSRLPEIIDALQGAYDLIDGTDYTDPRFEDEVVSPIHRKLETLLYGDDHLSLAALTASEPATPPAPSDDLLREWVRPDPWEHQPGDGLSATEDDIACYACGGDRPIHRPHCLWVRSTEALRESRERAEGTR